MHLLEVTARHAAGVRHDIGDDHETAVLEQPAGICTRRRIRGFDAVRACDLVIKAGADGMQQRGFITIMRGP